MSYYELDIKAITYKVGEIYVCTIVKGVLGLGLSKKIKENEGKLT